MSINTNFMQRCIELAAEAKSNGKTPVGAVLVRNEEIIAEGVEGSPELPLILAHAEIVAIIRATEILGSKDLSSCVLYTNVEPCVMCSYIIRETAISKVVYGRQAGVIGGISGVFRILSSVSINKWSRPPEIKQGSEGG
ncbi:nucleoside deaminase [Desertivirga brevis]|uniref:nucleoside deaminase n=1 Tax=Desertivirga brevis TaxID=2810310 RepID=UPI001A97907C|nr:nucleoside deaminase [Pedobacter sp. SYSU D00873]